MVAAGLEGSPRRGAATERHGTARRAVTGVAKAALYLSAETGEQPAAFRDVDFARALE